MKRFGLLALFAACAAAGLLAATVAAGASPVSALTTTGATLSKLYKGEPKPDPPKPEPKPKPKPKPKSARIALGVTIAGVKVGKMKPRAAEQKVRRLVNRAFQLRAGNLRLWARPEALGFRAYVKPAVKRALKARPGAKLRLRISNRPAVVRRYVAALAERFHRDPVNSVLELRGIAPFVNAGDSGRDLERAKATRAILFALGHNQRRPVRLAVKRLPQTVSRSSFGPVIVIRRGSNELHLYHGMEPWRTFQVATGQSAYPTPLGHWEIVEMWRDPWWIPPNSSWAKGAKPIPPGPGNPLGTRWMGLSASAVGIHGTPDAASIGYSASHGCIRMHIWEAEWLFDHVHVGTPVFIVSA